MKPQALLVTFAMAALFAPALTHEAFAQEMVLPLDPLRQMTITLDPERHVTWAETARA